MTSKTYMNRMCNHAKPPNTFTFNSTEVTPGTYNVTVTATRSNSSDSSLTPVTLTSTGSITIGMSGE